MRMIKRLVRALKVDWEILAGKTGQQAQMRTRKRADMQAQAISLWQNGRTPSHNITAVPAHREKSNNT